MKRVKAACICQTLHFSSKEEAEPERIAKLVRQETEQYKRNLERSRIQYKVLEEVQQPDGSVLMKVIKQYNTSPVGDYLD